MAEEIDNKKLIGTFFSNFIKLSKQMNNMSDDVMRIAAVDMIAEWYYYQEHDEPEKCIEWAEYIEYEASKTVMNIFWNTVIHNTMIEINEVQNGK